MQTRPVEEDLTELRALTDELSDSDQLVLQRVREARRELAPPGPPIAFVHIPKTAGGTATSMLARAFTKQAITDGGNIYRSLDKVERKLRGGPGGWEGWSRRGKRVTAGHVPYAMFREHLPPDTRYMTFLREPVDRVLSHYYRHIHQPDPRGDLADRRRRYQEEGKAGARSLEEAFTELGIVQLSNLCTRFLCGPQSPMGELHPGALDEAKANLREFTFVGIQERFEESLVLLQRKLGLGFVPYWDRHVNTSRPAVEEVSDADRALIEEYNQLDIELYRFASELFEEDVAAAGEGLARDVERLRVVASDANREAIEKAHEWLEDALPPGSVELTSELRAAARAAGHAALPLAEAHARIEQAGRGAD